MNHLMIIALLLVLGTVSPLCQAQTPLQLAKPHRLPPHEVKLTRAVYEKDSFLAWRPDGHALLYDTDKGIAEYPGSRRSLPGIWATYARWNKQGTKVLIGNKEQAWVIDERRFKVLRRYGSDTHPVVSAWWNGDHIGLLKTDLKHPLHFPASEHPIGDGYDYLYAQYVLENGHRLPVPRTVTLTATSDDGSLFLGSQAVLQTFNGENMYQVVLLHLNRQHRFQRRLRLPAEGSKSEGLGDFICTSPAHDLVFGLQGDPDAFGDWNDGYYYSSRTGKAHVIALDDVIRPEVFFVGGHFIGICRFTDSPTSTPAHPLDLSPYPAIEDYRFTCTGGRVRLEALPFIVTGYAVSLATSREAFLDQDNKLVIRPLSFADKPGKSQKQPSRRKG